jgi:Rho termination factor, N-terminal domain
MTVQELQREAARLNIEGRSKMGKAQLIRAVGQKRRSRSS